MKLSKKEKFDKVAELLKTEHAEFLACSVDGTHVLWRCSKGHGVKRTETRNFLKGHRCISCRLEGNVILPGTKNGDLEVIEYLGVVKTWKQRLSKVRVRNNINGLEEVMLTGDFTSGKRKILSNRSSSKKEKFDKVAELLKKENATFLACSVDGKCLLWQCSKGHSIKRSHVRDFLKGTRCINCSLIGKVKRQPTVILPGTKNGDLEVIEYLGVVKTGTKGFSKVRVRNNINGVERVMLTSEFASGKKKLLSKEELAELSKNNGLNRKGFRNIKNSKYNWQDVFNVCKEHGFEFINPPENTNDNVFQSGKRGVWEFKCHCGNLFKPMLSNVLAGGVKSCGCVKSWPQIELANFVRDLSLNVIVNDRLVIAPYEVDIYLPDLKVGIEYCGLFWHGEKFSARKSKFHIYEKYLKAKSAGLTFITVFEDEWLNTKEAVKEALSFILRNKTQLCVNDDAKTLIDKYPLLGECTTKKSKTVLELDNRWDSNDIFYKMGFVKTKNIKPSCWYMKDRTQVLREYGRLWNKDSVSGKFGCLGDETVWETVSRNGYDRIWDCGTSLLVST